MSSNLKLYFYSNWSTLFGEKLYASANTLLYLFSFLSLSLCTSKDNRGRIPLDLAKQRNRVEIVAILTKAAEEQKAKQKP